MAAGQHQQFMSDTSRLGPEEGGREGGKTSESKTCNPMRHLSARAAFEFLPLDGLDALKRATVCRELLLGHLLLDPGGRSHEVKPADKGVNSK